MVTALPASSVSGEVVSKATAPGPRYLLHTSPNWLGRSAARRLRTPSSIAHTATCAGSATAACTADRERTPYCPCPASPAGDPKRTTGGVLPLVTSWSASISHSGRRCPGIAMVSPYAVSDHVSRPSKSAGTTTANMPVWRLGRKWVGCPRSAGPGSKRLSGPTGMSRCSS